MLRDPGRIFPMQIHVRSVPLPRWLAPLLILAALALIPFALMLGLVLAAVVIGASALRLLLPSPVKPGADSFEFPFSRNEKKISDHSAIDAEYEVRDPHEKK
jgi:hypothetical protein